MYGHCVNLHVVMVFYTREAPPPLELGALFGVGHLALRLQKKIEEEEKEKQHKVLEVVYILSNLAAMQNLQLFIKPIPS